MRWLTLCGLLLLSLGSHANDTVLSAEVLVFDSGLIDQYGSNEDVFPEIREVEALLWSYSLRQALAESNDFGVVRLQTRSDLLADFTVRGRILHSNGFDFTVAVSMYDASGREWYSTEVEGAASQPEIAFGQFRRDVERKLSDIPAAELRRLTELSLLRYGGRLAPEVFGDYLAEDRDGFLTLARLPSANDPMVMRLMRVREASYLVSDSIDEKFASLGGEVGRVYDAWRAYRKQNVSYQQENLRRGEVGIGEYDRGSFEAYKRLYDLYKWDRQAAQEQDRLAVAFGNEVDPKISVMQQRVSELLIWIDAKNAEWFRLLQELFEVETRVEEVAEPAG